MKQIPIAIIMPSRGLPFARTIEWVEKQRKTYPIELFISHDLPIPECFNKLVAKALKGRFIYLLFLEDDIVPPDNALDKLIEGMAWGQITCMDYPFRGGYGNVSKSKDGEVMSCGTGCMLVSRNVFDYMDKPYFRSDMRYDWQTQKWSKVDPHKVYGLHDMWFTYRVRQSLYRIYQVKGECKHLGLTKLAKPNTNMGCHYIAERPKISQKLIAVDKYI